MKGLFIFVAGVAVGAVTGAYLVKDKVLADAKQEIEEVREYYKSKQEKVVVPEEKKEVEVKEEYELKEESKKEYEELTKQYTNYVKPENEPYVIDPEEFGNMEEEGWDTMTITYFADGVLVDDVDDVIDEPDVVIGLDNLKIFEEFPDATSVYVRNDIWRTDFEILKDDWKWSDLKDPSQGKKPHQL